MSRTNAMFSMQDIMNRGHWHIVPEASVTTSAKKITFPSPPGNINIKNLDAATALLYSFDNITYKDVAPLANFEKTPCHNQILYIKADAGTVTYQIDFTTKPGVTNAIKVEDA